MNTTHEDLTTAEEGYLKHTRAAKEQGVSLREYCAAAGLNVQTLYNGRRGLRSYPDGVREPLSRHQGSL